MFSAYIYVEEIVAIMVEKKKKLHQRITWVSYKVMAILIASELSKKAFEYVYIQRYKSNKIITIINLFLANTEEPYDEV